MSAKMSRSERRGVILLCTICALLIICGTAWKTLYTHSVTIPTETISTPLPDTLFNNKSEDTTTNNAPKHHKQKKKKHKKSTTQKTKPSQTIPVQQPLDRVF